MTTAAAAPVKGKKRGPSVPDLSSEADGISVITSAAEGSHLVQFEYNPRLVSMLRRIEGAEYLADQNVWTVPVTQSEQLAKLIPAMRGEVVADRTARGEIENLAVRAALQAQKDHGSADVEPKISAYRKAGEPSLGEMIGVNGHYAAQLTGFGMQDGVAFVKLHRLGDLNEQVFKGDYYAITYNDKGRGQVEQYEPIEQRRKRYEQNLGRAVDGVKVREVDDVALVEFDYTPAMARRIGKVEGAEFDRDTKVWAIPLEANAGVNMRDVVARTVDDLRRERVADEREFSEMVQTANAKIDGANVKPAFTKEGSFSTGPVLSVGERYVLQATGKEFAAIHRADALDKSVDVGHAVRIEYGKGGKAAVSERGQQRGGNER